MLNLNLIESPGTVIVPIAHATFVSPELLEIKVGSAPPKFRIFLVVSGIYEYPLGNVSLIVSINLFLNI